MKRLFEVALILLVLVVLWLVSPLSSDGLHSHEGPVRSGDVAMPPGTPRPLPGYQQVVKLVAERIAQDGAEISSECRTKLYTHGSRTHRVIVLFHGLTNCPAQWDSIGRMLFADGANVFIPRLPHHGYANRMTDELARMDAHELREFTDRALDIADALGDSVTIAGLSVGGTMAAWAAQNRPDVDRAVLIAPMLGVARARGGWTPIVARVAGALPNLFVWWDDRQKEQLGGPKHVYPRFSTRSVAATLKLGWMVHEDATRKPPACRSIEMITVGGDVAVDNLLNAEVVRAISM